MGRRKHAFPPLLFLFSLFLFFHSSHAFFIWEHRKLMALDSKVDNTNKTDTPPNDSLPPSQKNPDPKPAPVGAETKNNKEDPKGSNNTTISPKGSNNNNNTIVSPNPTPLTKVENEKGDNQKELKDSAPPANAPPPVVAKSGGEQEKNKKEGKTGSESVTNDSCDGLNKCNDDGDMVACISMIDPKSLVVLIQNNGDGPIKVKPVDENNHGDIEVGKHQTKKINISLISSEITQLTLTAGKGNCVLHMDTPVPEASFFLRLPTFDNILTPVNGAYFLILTVLVLGGTWGCCKLRKKRHDEVPYQELEMALPESASATNLESAEGWDQDWDDDWDDNVAVKSPAAHRAGSISANGLTSRSSNKDGWENNWDD